MHPDDWDEFTEGDVFWEMFKPFRNQPWSHFIGFLLGGLVLSFALFDGVLLATGNWERVVVRSLETDSAIQMTWIAMYLTVAVVSPYMVIGFAYGKGGPVINLLSSILFPMTALTVTGKLFTDQPVETVAMDPGPFFNSKNIIVMLPLALPWVIAILWRSRLESRDPERVREFEQRHMPFPFKLDQLLEENKEQ